MFLMCEDVERLAEFVFAFVCVCVSQCVRSVLLLIYLLAQESSSAKFPGTNDGEYI
jgi:hypothetical protein